MTEERVIGYHSAARNRYKKILREGFDPIKYSYNHPNPDIKHEPWTWFTEDENYAYGRACLKVDLTGLDCIVNKGTCIICKEKFIPPERILAYSLDSEIWITVRKEED